MRFIKGKVYTNISKSNAVLCTGEGNKKVGYPCFSAVVIWSNGSEDAFKVGVYSDTWGKNAFMNTSVSLQKAITPLI